IINKRNMSDISILSNYPPEWVSSYKENGFQRIDPVVLQASVTNSPFLWGKDIHANTKLIMNRIFSQSKKYDIESGYTFVLHDYNNHLVTLSLISGDKNQGKLVRGISECEKDIQMLLIKTHEEMVSLYKEIKEKDSKKKAFLTKRENEILYLASTGKTYMEISTILDIKTPTVKFHMAKIVNKIGALNAKHAISLAIESGIIIPPLL
ncbi:helix-turn-helix transcriptional regulator, partial [Enterobacter bugandensis]|uniref:helix-turn-helix transcriptional regulator n=1 Tax=Enterobacter bugandensis TaxID=881260 RepID=UPI003D6EA7A4